MGLIGGTLLYYIVCFCARVALDDMGQKHLIRKKIIDTKKHPVRIYHVMIIIYKRYNYLCNMSKVMLPVSLSLLEDLFCHT